DALPPWVTSSSLTCSEVTLTIDSDADLRRELPDFRASSRLGRYQMRSAGRTPTWVQADASRPWLAAGSLERWVSPLVGYALGGTMGRRHRSAIRPARSPRSRTR